MRNCLILRGSLPIVAAVFFVGCAEGLSPTRPTSFSASEPAGSTPQAAVQSKGRVQNPLVPASRRPLPLTKAVVTAVLEVQDWGTPDKFLYGIGLRLTESAGVSATFTSVEIVFDEWWGAICTFNADQYWETTIPANGTLVLEPIGCENYWPPYFVEIFVSLKDANGHVVYAWAGHGFESAAAKRK